MNNVVVKAMLSLRRVGIDNVDVSVVGPNCICISGSVASNDDKALAFAVARTTPGVAFVTHEICVIRPGCLDDHAKQQLKI